MNICVHRHTTHELMSDSHGCQSKTKGEGWVSWRRQQSHKSAKPSLLHQVSLYSQIYSMGQEGEGKTLIYSSCVGSFDKSRQHKLSFPQLSSWFGVSAALSGAGISPNPGLKKLLALRKKQKDTREVYVAFSLWAPEQYSEY